MNRIKIFCQDPDRHALKNLWQRYMIHPLRIFYGDGSLNWDLYKADFKFYENLYHLVDDPIIADFHVLPFAINYYLDYQCFSLAKEAYQYAQLSDKILLIAIEGDFDLKKHFSQALYLKYASFKSKNFTNEIIRPGDVKVDLLEQYYEGRLLVRSKSAMPSVGFVGLASYVPHRLIALVAKNILERLLAMIRLREFRAPSILPFLLKRGKIIKVLTSNSEILTNFKIRKKFAFGIRVKDDSARLEFIQNIYDSDYTLCVRGQSNYSIRFYETMCLGRIPLFLNTDCVLPFEDKIDWKKAVAWIDERDEKRIDKALLAFHRSLSDAEFKERQRYCREIWVKYLSKKGFETELSRTLKDKL
jgi:hypothetical protein